jgi:hypothetical protein
MQLRLFLFITIILSINAEVQAATNHAGTTINQVVKQQAASYIWLKNADSLHFLETQPHVDLLLTSGNPYSTEIYPVLGDSLANTEWFNTLQIDSIPQELDDSIAKNKLFYLWAVTTTNVAIDVALPSTIWFFLTGLLGFLGFYRGKL